MSNYFYKKDSLDICGDSLLLELPRKHFLSGNITISQEILHRAEEVGVKLIEAKYGRYTYKASTQYIKNEGINYSGYFFLPIHKWKKVPAKK